MNRLLLRATGAATALYGIAVTVRPDLLARPSGLLGPDGGAPEVATALRPLGLRDAACGAAMALAPDDRSLRTAALLRIAADFGDAALLSRTLPTARHRRAALAVSIGWGALSVAGLLGRSRTAAQGTARDGT
ncbi:hypothetical protein ACIGXM_15040 [Kitasatospora sp. NPDC052896]|uniref:hypothetical protein n=1 Tax=Kitasatospora sp. NPDC052896 TaxID=3364061 RepID=UPI0037C5174D